MSRSHDAAWNAFWSAHRGGAGGGCLPGSSAALEAAQQAAWRGFAPGIARGGRVLDLATGDGRVMAWLLAARRDLKPVGVDLANQLPPPPRGAAVQGGVAMESLPFTAGRFAAVVSQFGFEYGDLPQVAREMRRVLADSGVCAVLTHRQDGPILEHNLRRRDAIRWAIEAEDLPGKAKRSFALRQTGIGAVPAIFDQAPARGAQQFGPGSAAWEIAEAIRQSLHYGRNDHPARVAGAIDAIVGQARGELGRISALESACAAIADAGSLERALADAGLRQVAITPVCEAGSERPVADFRVFQPA